MSLKYPDLVQPKVNFAVLYKRYPNYNMFAVLPRTKKARLRLLIETQPTLVEQYIKDNMLYFTCCDGRNQIKKEGEIVSCQDMLLREA